MRKKYVVCVKVYKSKWGKEEGRVFLLLVESGQVRGKERLKRVQIGRAHV